MSPATEALADELAAAVLEKVKAGLGSMLAAPQDDPALSVSEAAKVLGISPTTMRNLINNGIIHRCPGISEMRVRRSVLNAYGKPPTKKTRP
jgi:excisionase family DNA binding protein